MSLFDLPIDIQLHILQDWISFSSLIKVDLACCNLKHRADLFSLYSHSAFKLSLLSGPLRQVSLATETSIPCLQWIAKRNINVPVFNIMISMVKQLAQQRLAQTQTQTQVPKQSLSLSSSSIQAIAFQPTLSPPMSASSNVGGEEEEVSLKEMRVFLSLFPQLEGVNAVTWSEMPAIYWPLWSVRYLTTFALSSRSVWTDKELTHLIRCASSRWSQSMESLTLGNVMIQPEALQIMSTWKKIKRLSVNISQLSSSSLKSFLSTQRSLQAILFQDSLQVINNDFLQDIWSNNILALEEINLIMCSQVTPAIFPMLLARYHYHLHYVAMVGLTYTYLHGKRVLWLHGLPEDIVIAILQACAQYHVMIDELHLYTIYSSYRLARVISETIGSSLETLCFIGSHFQSELLHLTTHCAKLSDIALHFGGEAIDLSSYAFSNYGHLIKKLTLSHKNNLKDDDLLATLSHCPNLTILHLSYCKAISTNVLLPSLARSCPKLEDLDLIATSCSEEKEVVSFLSTYSNMSKLKVALSGQHKEYVIKELTQRLDANIADKIIKNTFFSGVA
eukprot:scaffold1462_cov168-Ochromonas_danica.AAC.1